MADVKNCITCGNAIFDSLWGEYKCAIGQHRVYKPDEVPTDCKGFVEGKPKEAQHDRTGD